MTQRQPSPDPMASTEGPKPREGVLDGLSARATARYGLLLAVLLLLTLVALLAMDRSRRLADAEREVSGLAVGTRGQVYYGLRDAERVLLFAARLEARRRAGVVARPGSPGDSPDNARVLSDLLADRPELDGFIVLEGEEPGVAAWAVAAQPGRSSMRFGPPHRDADGAWVVPLAVPLSAEGPGWVAVHYRLDALQDLVMRMRGDGPALIAIMDSRRYVLARTEAPETRVGTQIDDVELQRRITSGVDEVIDHHVGRGDGVARVRAYQASQYFPLQIGAGLPRRAVLMPWYILAALGTIGYALYWVGFMHLLKIVRRAEEDQARLLQEIGRSGELLSFALRAGGMGAWAMQRDRGLWWSDAVGPLHGFPSGTVDLKEDVLLSRVHPEDLTRVLNELDTLRDRGEDLALDYRVVAVDGGIRHLSTRGARVHTPGSDIVTSGVVMDVTAQVVARQQLLNAERQFRLMFERNPLPFWVFDIDTLRFLEVNHAAIQNYGYSREEFLSMTLHDIRPSTESSRLLANVASRAPGDEPSIWIHRRKDGTEIEARVHAADIEHSARQARLVLAEDVSDRRRAERELDYRASHDLLTGLPNETAFVQRLDELIARHRHASIDVVRVVLQRHALVSDSLGANVADALLREAAVRLSQVVTEPGVVARMQGAEFIVATPAAAGDPTGAALLEVLYTALREPVWAADAPHYLDATFGLAVHPHDGAAADALVRNAGLAVHDVAQHPSTDRVRYSAGLAKQMSARLAMLARLRQAIEQGAFELHYQPILDLASGSVCGYEALARWPQPDGSHVPPGEFIPLCEDSALIVPLGRWVLHEAARAWRMLAAAGLPPQPIAVNVSVTQFTRSDLVHELRTVIDAHDLPPGALELELTEGVVMSDPEHVIRTLGELRAMGALLSIDDFGTGYSNLAYLRRLPVHTLKIDRLFMQDVVTDPQNAAICRSIVSLAALFDMQVTAEGIETREQLDWCRDNGADKVQGFLLGRPAPLQKLLATPSRIPPPGA